MTLDTDFSTTLAAAQDGADWAVTALFREFQPPLLRFLRAQASSAGEDLASEVWLAVAQKLDGFTGDESGFRAWLFTIARRRLIDHRRRAGRRRTDPVPLEVLQERAGSDDPAEAATAARSAQEAIALLAANLSPEQSEVVLLRVVGGFSAEEVARITGRSAGSVRVMQHRALQRLAHQLREGAVSL